jgi:hypothetical protein
MRGISNVPTSRKRSGVLRQFPDAKILLRDLFEEAFFLRTCHLIHH